MSFNADHKDYHQPSKSSSNDNTSAKSCAALIQDVGEDDSVSSLNLFVDKVDLPPSSYPDSLEKLWDEEEDPEERKIVTKVVPSACHHYLDVLSRVKAEKPPSHCACDHHIELKGSLPPVGLIYSLSNQESDFKT
ncbi:hypothetical protein O181_063148 [Austropuccinia psidii MF-1]|uniref:Uncharacterized protein n=1 Tax=Austropuccinia psidii MF-1 TaxID=1389203 RepID=A0A9Q3I0B2_9BASI|nr:hypothetical protein [Austropuccinia psidii MF-1]